MLSVDKGGGYLGRGCVGLGRGGELVVRLKRFGFVRDLKCGDRGREYFRSDGEYWSYSYDLAVKIDMLAQVYQTALKQADLIVYTQHNHYFRPEHSYQLIYINLKIVLLLFTNIKLYKLRHVSFKK